MTTATALEFEHLTYRYETRSGSLTALDDLSLTVSEGEFVSIVGRSGCGKSTLLRLAAGLLTPTAGTVRGKSVERTSKANGDVGLMFQTPVLMPWRNVLDNVTLIEELRARRPKRERAVIRERAKQIIGLVGLSEFLSHMPAQLSGGMQQRVALARALTLNPDILFLDEPFGALDALTREDMNFELQRVWLSKKTTVVLVTHNIAEAVLLSDRIVVMSPRPGRIVDEVVVPLERPRTRETTLSEEFRNIQQRVLNVLLTDVG
jgi:NitT/TauT family transport system ATP-binding protein